jgi:hypothetical protein
MDLITKTDEICVSFLKRIEETDNAVSGIFGDYRPAWKGVSIGNVVYPVFLFQETGGMIQGVFKFTESRCLPCPCLHVSRNCPHNF